MTMSFLPNCNGSNGTIRVQFLHFGFSFYWNIGIAQGFRLSNLLRERDILHGFGA
jgi:hypothetical protein